MAAVEVMKNNYVNMSPLARVSFFAGVLVIIIFFIWGVFLIFKDNYSVLYSDLESKDASLVISELDKNKIKYKLEDGGRKILVDNDLVYKTRLNVVSNVPMLNGGVGFEIFDKDDFGTTEFAQKINFQRALQGELVRTIMSLNEIKMARVHLVLAESSLFKKNESNSRASVTLIMKRGTKLSQRQVSGIQKLVASSTPGLKSSNVTILNQRGITLVSNDEDVDNVIAASKKLDRKKEVEEYLSAKAQKILDRTFGVNVAYVSIDVLIDFNNIKTTREQVISPGKEGVNISRKKEIKMSGNKKQEADTSRSTIEVDYALSKQVEQIVSTPGTVKRMSIAIVTPIIIDAQRSEHLKITVGNAVGYNSSRGDLIALSSQSPEEKGNTINHVTKVLNESLSDETLNNNEIQDTKTNYDDKYLAWIAHKMQGFLKVMYSTPLFSFFSLLGLLVLILGYKVISAFITKPVETSPKKFSDNEKEQLLSDLKNWLATDSK